jgi:predicted transcriptional regulator YheO
MQGLTSEQDTKAVAAAIKTRMDVNMAMLRINYNVMWIEALAVFIGTFYGS